MPKPRTYVRGFDVPEIRLVLRPGRPRRENAPARPRQPPFPPAVRALKTPPLGSGLPVLSAATWAARAAGSRPPPPPSMAKKVKASPDPATPKAKKDKKRRAYSGSKLPRRKRPFANAGGSEDNPDPAAGSSAVADEHAPHGPKPTGAKAWAALTFKTTTTCSGGYGTRGRNSDHPAVSITVYTELGEERFFHIERGKAWVFKTVGAPKQSGVSCVG